MKANEFVKKFGWEVAENLVNRDKTSIRYLPVEYCELNQDDLKRLVESHELVGRYGTADEAKEYLPMLRMDSYDDLKQAILDVESCQ